LHSAKRLASLIFRYALCAMLYAMGVFTHSAAIQFRKTGFRL